LRFPEERFTVLCLCNVLSADAQTLSRKVADIYLSQKLQPVPAAPTAAILTSPKASQFVGKYFSPQSHATYSFHLVGDKLAFAGLPLRVLDANRFELLGSTVDFDDSNGKTKVTIRQGGVIAFTGSRIDALTVSPADLDAVAGTYASTELNTTYKLTVQNGALTLQSNWKPPVTLAPVARDEFDGPLGGYFSGILVFHRDASGGVSGFHLFSGGVRNLSFERTK
jgi:hypothetical protein